jgi:pyruvate dehydrogenase E2 component (dihydrolipoamide acetyltransferase)
MPIDILMPALSPTMEKGNLAKWLKKEGDRIKAGDVIAEIETDKATMEVEAVDEGVLAKILVAEGSQDVPVNQAIGVIAADGEDAGSVGAGSAKAPAAKAAPPPAAAPAPKVPEAAAPAKPAAAPAANGVAASASKSANGASGGRVFASPLARRIASEAGIDIARVNGSGPHGRIVAADIEAAKSGDVDKLGLPPGLREDSTTKAPPKAAPAPSMSDDQVRKLFAPDSYVEVPHDSMRKTIARRLVEAKSTIPHFYLTVDCDIDALLKLREQMNAAAPADKDGKPSFKLSVNDMVIKALAMALKAVPDANVSWTDGAMLKHKHADVGVAVSIPGGLITPIIKDACHKTLSVISNEMKDLAGRAKNRKLKPEEYQGGTTAVSNLGMFGVKDFSAVINPPQATILAVGAGEKRAVVKADGSIGAATIMSATLSCDHRAVDGALGAELIAAFRRYIENPVAMLV